MVSGYQHRLHEAQRPGAIAVDLKRARIENVYHESALAGLFHLAFFDLLLPANEAINSLYENLALSSRKEGLLTIVYISIVPQLAFACISQGASPDKYLTKSL